MTYYVQKVIFDCNGKTSNFIQVGFSKEFMLELHVCQLLIASGRV